MNVQSENAPPVSGSLFGASEDRFAGARPDDHSQYAQYRALSISAVVTFVAALVSLLGLMFVPMLAISGVGLLLGTFSVWRIRRRPDELTGLVPANVGRVICLAVLVGGSVMHAIIYLTEVPEGYTRISQLQLKWPKTRGPLERPTPFALEMAGKKVFIKGYMLPGPQTTAVKRFVLVPDMKSCCFGGDPALTDMILVTLPDPYRLDYSYKRHKLGGTLTVNQRLKAASGVDGVYYELDVDYLR